MSGPAISAERWQRFSLAEQLGNIGSELSRAARFKQQKELERFTASLDRAHDLVIFTVADPRWRNRLRELLRFREAVSDWYLNGITYGISLAKLVEYCLPFALLARKDR
jgi:hypothetical protein